MKRRFIGKQGKYQIDKDAIVNVISFYPKRRALIMWKGKLYVTLTTLLRKEK